MTRERRGSSITTATRRCASQRHGSAASSRAAASRSTTPPATRCRPGEIGEIYLPPATAGLDFTVPQRRRLAPRDRARRADHDRRHGLSRRGSAMHCSCATAPTTCVISGGVNIYPAEIEAVLIDMPGVHDCAVFGIPDEAVRREALRLCRAARRRAARRRHGPDLSQASASPTTRCPRSSSHPDRTLPREDHGQNLQAPPARSLLA